MHAAAAFQKVICRFFCSLSLFHIGDYPGPRKPCPAEKDAKQRAVTGPHGEEGGDTTFFSFSGPFFFSSGALDLLRPGGRGKAERSERKKSVCGWELASVWQG